MTTPNLSARLINSYCCFRAKRLAMLVHATTRIPLSERQIISVEERMQDSAIEATSEDDVTNRVNAVQDAFLTEIQFRTPGMWKFCRKISIVTAFRLSLESKKKKTPSSFGIAWRSRVANALCRRMFKLAARSADDADVNARLDEACNAVLREHGIAA
jgi:hypothetical protein